VSETLEVTCPLCGGIVEAGTEDELVRTAKLHTLDAHHYDVPAEHVLQLAERYPGQPGQ
jgi:pyochelin biosynthesis protein PchC